MTTWKCILILSAVPALYVCRDVTYNELKTLGVTCSPHDTCNTTLANRQASRRNCECDNDCSFYGDCCLDANSTASRSASSTSLTCQQTGTNSGYFTVSKCRRGWGDAEVRRKCEGLPNQQDPMSLVPVTTPTTTLNYRNRYCAACNNVRDNLLFWKLGVECPELSTSMEKYVRNNLAYNINRASWGVYLEGKFYICYLKPVAPKNSKNLRFCYPKIISSCSSMWKDEFIRDKCESYTAYVHIREDDISYRNVHCAICSNVRPARLSCEHTFGKDFERTSFTTIFDIDLSKGNEIAPGGSTPRCKKGEVYDPAFKRCQVLTCGLPFLELRDGKCVNKSG